MPELLQTIDNLASSGIIFEHIIVDGGSTDGTVELAARYAELRDNVLFVSEPDRGIFDAMNKGANLASGDYVIHINADDYLVNLSDWCSATRQLSELAPLILSSPVALVKKENREPIRILPGKPINFFHRNHGFHFPHQGTFIKKELVTLNGGYNINIGYIADKIFFFKVLDDFNDCKIIYFPKILCHQMSGGISSQSKLTVFKTIWLTIMAAHHVQFKSPLLRACLNPVFKVLMLGMRR